MDRDQDKKLEQLIFYVKVAQMNDMIGGWREIEKAEKELQDYEDKLKLYEDT